MYSLHKNIGLPEGSWGTSCVDFAEIDRGLSLVPTAGLKRFIEPWDDNKPLGQMRIYTTVFCDIPNTYYHHGVNPALMGME